MKTFHIFYNTKDNTNTHEIVYIAQSSQKMSPIPQVLIYNNQCIPRAAAELPFYVVIHAVNNYVVSVFILLLLKFYIYKRYGSGQCLLGV